MDERIPKRRWRPLLWLGLALAALAAVAAIVARWPRPVPRVTPVPAPGRGPWWADDRRVVLVAIVVFVALLLGFWVLTGG